MIIPLRVLIIEKFELLDGLLPLRRLIGTLSDEERVLVGLDIKPKK